MKDDPMTRQQAIVAFQGEPGAFSEQAIHEHFGPKTATLPCRNFTALFEAVHHGQATQAMLPVENSLAGMVVPAYDLLIDHDLRVQAEVIVRVEHNLMAPAGTALRDVKRVRSHHQALAQCERNLRRLGLEPVDHYDTAGAARDLAANPEPGTAAIASALAAETYNLEILVQNIEDLDFNFTRFFVLGRTDPPRQEPCKTSIIFTTRHVPGALYDVLGELASRNINLTKIESRPRRNRPWHYRFFVDFEGHEEDEVVQEAMLGILKRSSFLQVLGSYPMATMPR
jgi:prephenate dehydratase